MSTPAVFQRAESSEAAASGTDLRQYLSLLLHHWLLIAFCTALGIGAGVFIYETTPRLFRSTAVLQIERRSLSSTVTGGDAFLESWWNTEYYPTQYRLLRSRGLAEVVVDRLILDPVPGFDPRSLAGGGDVDPSDAKAALAESLRGGLDVRPIEQTQLVEVSYESSDPMVARELANHFADGFVDWGQKNRRQIVDSAASFLAEEIDDIKAKIAETDRRLKERQVANSATGGGRGADNVDDRLASLNENYSAAVSRRIEKEARYQSVLDAPIETVAIGAADSRVGQLSLEQGERERRYASQLETYKPDWPEMLELKAEIERGATDLREAIEEAATKARQDAYTEYQTVLREEQQLLGEISRLRGEALDASTQSVELEDLRRGLTNKQEQLQSILQRQAATQVEARLDETGDTGNVRVIDRALLPTSPFQPRLTRNLSAGAASGLAIGAALAFLLAFLDRSIKTAEEGERLLGLPTLGVIADVTAAQGRYGYAYGDGERRRRKGRRSPAGEVEIELVPMRHPRHGVSESYRSLRAGLLLSSAKELRILAVTSASAGEGKSSTTMNLACVMAQLGKRVLLIDGDLHKPRLHKVLGVSNRAGLVSCLAAGLAPDDAVVRTEFDNLWLTPSGPSSPNPSELLGSERLTEVLATYRSSFDMVLIDTPPVLALSDAILIGASCDGMVFCVRAGKASQEELRGAVDRLRFASVKILGTVLNRYLPERHVLKKSQRYYHYQYYPYAKVEETNSAA